MTNEFYPTAHAANCAKTLGELLTDQYEKGYPVQIIRDLFPDGTKYAIVIGTGTSAEILNSLVLMASTGEPVDAATAPPKIVDFPGPRQ